MTHFRITEKTTGKAVYEYLADNLIWFDSWPSDKYTQSEVVTPIEPTQEYNGSWLITRLAFRSRLTTSEKEDIEVASIDNANATTAARKRAASLRVYMADIQASEYIDLKDARLRNGIMALQTLGLLDAGRAVEILDSIPTEVELYK